MSLVVFDNLPDPTPVGGLWPPPGESCAPDSRLHHIEEGQPAALRKPVIDPNPQVVPRLVGVPLAVGYAQALRYMTVRRSDQSTAYQWGTWLLTPVAVVFALVVLRAIRWYGIVTCWRTGWGTRKQVEVALAA